MDKSRVCVGHATKLAKQKCVKKTNMLVYEKKDDPCMTIVKPGGYIVPPIAALPAKKIRICTGAELRRMCPPKLCSCPPKKRRLGFLGALGALFGLGIKAGIAAAVVYWTYDIGLWGDPEETEDLYMDICDLFLPQQAKKHKKRYISPVCQAEIDLMCKPPAKDAEGKCAKSPSTEQTVYSLQERWNKVVVRVFDVLTDIPGYTVAAYHYVTQIGKDSTCPNNDHKK